jgi:hypothetical protein
VEEDESYSWLVLEYTEGLYLFSDSEEDFRLSSLEVDRRFPDELQEVQWGPLFGSDDGIIWPESD